jgi:hypothetical protein
MITASGERQRGSPQLRRWPDASCCCPPLSFLGLLVLENGSLDWQRLEGRRLGERLGAPAFLIYGTRKEIVAGDRGAYPEEVGW